MVDRTNIFFAIFVCILLSPSFLFGVGRGISEPIELNANTFHQVAILIFEQTGYTLHVDKQLIDINITGRYGKQTIEAFLKRVLIGKNYIFTVDDSKKEILVRLYGSKDFVDLVDISASNRSLVDQVTLQTYDEINNSIAKAKDDMEWVTNDENSIDPISGLSYVEINKSLNEKQIYQEDILDPVSGCAIDEINHSIELALLDIEKISKDPEVIDPVSGVSFVEINRLIQLSTEDIGSQIAGPEAIDPVSGLSYKEINEKLRGSN